MRIDPQWRYMQARLQARHGARLDPAQWRALDAARAADRYLETARGTALRRFAERFDARAPAHAMEQALRAEWQAYVAEAAYWPPRAWQPAVLWLQGLPDLPMRAESSTETPASDWLRRWRRLWPDMSGEDRAALDDLIAVVADHVRALAQAGRNESSARYRNALALTLVRLLRRHAATPVALLAHLGLALLDLERFRGGLVRRRLFAKPPERSAA